MRLSNFRSVTMVISVGFGLFSPVFALTSLDILAHQALSDNLSESNGAIAALRQQGPHSIPALINAYGAQLQNKQAGNSPTWQRFTTALDTICQQRDCYSSQLYWYTDLAQAKAAAKATGKPILSLRLLGKLDQELSCANSRFFRVALYPNAEISKLLRDRFILHWETVRPAPKITIDFGDGRKLERTITGNSIHYVLDADGNVIDALPGLYGPKIFLHQLEQAEKIVKQVNQIQVSEVNNSAAKINIIRQYQRDRLTEIQTKWKADLAKLDIPAPTGLVNVPTQIPTAQEAGRRAISKGFVELPIISAIGINQKVMSSVTDDSAWTKIAELHLPEALLDQNSQDLMRSKNSQAWNISNQGIIPGSSDDPLVPILNKFQSSIALDSVRNEYLLQPKIYAWLIDNPWNNVDHLNNQVYSDLFLTPSTDPWLGLLPKDAYSAIENEGANGKIK